MQLGRFWWAIGDLKLALCWPLNFFFGPKVPRGQYVCSPSFSVAAVRNMHLECLGQIRSWFLITSSSLVIASILLVCATSTPFTKNPTTTYPSAGFIPTAWKEAKMATAASTWGLLADVSCKPRHSGHSDHSAFHYDVLVAFVDRSPGGKYSLNLTLSVGSATRVQTLRVGVYWKEGVKNWIKIVVFVCM